MLKSSYPWLNSNLTLRRGRFARLEQKHWNLEIGKLLRTQNNHHRHNNKTVSRELESSTGPAKNPWRRKKNTGTEEEEEDKEEEEEEEEEEAH
jgi:hypothetical protein